MNPITTGIFVSPPLCGCAWEITALWAADGYQQILASGKSYQHPNGMSITAIRLADACLRHRQWLHAPVTVPPGRIVVRGGHRVWESGHERYSRRKWNKPGYFLQVEPGPIPKEWLTPDALHYMQHWRFHLSSWIPLSCACNITYCRDLSQSKEWTLGHPRYTRRCVRHEHDTADHALAIAEASWQDFIMADLHRLAPSIYPDVEAVGKEAGAMLRGAFPSLPESRIQAFIAEAEEREYQRQLALTRIKWHGHKLIAWPEGITARQREEMQAGADGRFGAGFIEVKAA